VWENPYPKFDPNVSWKRRTIKKDGKTQHHDQVFGDFKGTGRPQLAFWNQQAKTIFLADIPADPRNTEPWPFVAIFSGEAGERGDQGKFLYAEGMAAADIDADGKADCWPAIIGSSIAGETNLRPSKSARSAVESKRDNSNRANTRKSSSHRATGSGRSNGMNALAIRRIPRTGWPRSRRP